jgi:hypothetical protein
MMDNVELERQSRGILGVNCIRVLNELVKTPTSTTSLPMSSDRNLVANILSCLGPCP